VIPVPQLGLPAGSVEEHRGGSIPQSVPFKVFVHFPVSAFFREKVSRGGWGRPAGKGGLRYGQVAVRDVKKFGNRTDLSIGCQEVGPFPNVGSREAKPRGGPREEGDGSALSVALEIQDHVVAFFANRPMKSKDLPKTGRLEGVLSPPLGVKKMEPVQEGMVHQDLGERFLDDPVQGKAGMSALQIVEHG